MRNNLKGALVAAMLLGGGLAFADDYSKKQDEPATGGTGMDASASKTEVTGTVINANDKMLSLRNDKGESVPLKINEQTRFDDPAVKQISDLKPGQEVRASYSVDGADNVATEVQVLGAKGGSGMEGQPPAEGSDTGGSGDMNAPDAGAQEPDTGGSGNLGTPDSGTYDPATGGSGSERIDQPSPSDTNHPVDMQE